MIGNVIDLLVQGGPEKNLGTALVLVLMPLSPSDDLLPLPDRPTSGRLA